MSVTAWNVDLQIGLAGIDRQHKKLFSMLHELATAVASGQGLSEMSKLLSGLTIYTQTHFRLEEQYFEEFSYPDRESHQAEHFAFMRQLREFGHAFARGDADVDAQAFVFLAEWLRNHIKGTDQKYVEFLKSHGVR